MVFNEEEFKKRLLATFKIEADEHIQAMTQKLIELEQEPSAEYKKELIEIVYREAHSLKGAARAVDLLDVETICRGIESLFSALKKGEMEDNPGMFDVLHETLDLIKIVLENDPSLYNQSTILESVSNLNKLRAGEVVLTKIRGGQTENDIPEDSFSKEINNSNEPELESEGINYNPTLNGETDPLVFLEEPPHHDVPSNVNNIKSPIPPVTTNNNLDNTLKSENGSVNEKRSPVSKRSKDTIRIAIDKLDYFMMQTEELIPVKQRISQRLEEVQMIQQTVLALKKDWSKLINSRVGQEKSLNQRNGIKSINDFLNNKYVELNEICNSVNHIETDLQQDKYFTDTLIDNLLKDVRRVVMLPFTSLLSGMNKMVRDISRDQGKDIQFELKGAETEIDRKILQTLKDPIIHILRNSVDHGIENIPKRLKLNKSAKARISVTISQLTSNKVNINISDDGAGINPEDVKNKAINQSIITAQDAHNMSDDQLIDLVFHSGLSTAKIITDISGRGLGLAIVKDIIESLGGNISIKTELNKGTSFNIEIPISLATFRGVFIKASERTYALPTAYLKRVIRITPDEIHTVEGKQSIIYEDQTISYCRLEHVMEEKYIRIKSKNQTNYIPALILSHDNKLFAYGIDEVLFEQEVVIKPFDKILERVRNIAGVTVIGADNIVPLIYVPDLIRSTINNKASFTALEGSEQELKKSILIAEDSITARTMLKDVLEAFDYSVTAAVDGVEAYAYLQQMEFDCVISDIEMPRMTGFELCGKIRENEKYASLPIILVTALRSQKDRERGLEAGANAYIEKGGFNPQYLLDILKRLIG